MMKLIPMQRGHLERKLDMFVLVTDIKECLYIMQLASLKALIWVQASA